jgi:alkyl hydroperoxide reductase subunit AhpF
MIDTKGLIERTLADLPSPITIVSYTPEVESWYSRTERELLERVAAASPKITLRVLADRWDAKREAEAGIRRTPCIALRGAADPGLHYYGVPDGYELQTFLAMIGAVAEGRSGLGPRAVERVQSLDRPIHLEVLASPT